MALAPGGVGKMVRGSGRWLTPLGNLVGPAYGVAPGAATRWLKGAGLGLVRLWLSRRGGPVGCLLTLPMGQWFGGRAVPMTGIAGVAVAPEARGEGVAHALLAAALEELHSEGVATSTLYATAPTLYARLGWGDGGHRFRSVVRTADFSADRPPLPLHHGGRHVDAAPGGRASRAGGEGLPPGGRGRDRAALWRTRSSLRTRGPGRCAWRRGGAVRAVQPAPRWRLRSASTRWRLSTRGCSASRS